MDDRIGLSTTKYPRYQDYVIKDGKLVGEFEQMYRDFADPWEQSTREAFSAEKALALNAISALRPRKVMELGCGLGHFTARIKATGVPEVIGVDVSATALEKARLTAPGCTFVQGDILDYTLYGTYDPDVIVMAEISWYVLPKLRAFKEYLKTARPQTYVIHLLNTYPEGEQRYGKEYFTDLRSILSYFAMEYVEYGEIIKPLHGETRRTYFLGRYAPTLETCL